MIGRAGGLGGCRTEVIGFAYVLMSKRRKNAEIIDMADRRQ